jgi:hypothetical protein
MVRPCSMQTPYGTLDWGFTGDAYECTANQPNRIGAVGDIAHCFRLLQTGACEACRSELVHGSGTVKVVIETKN